MRSAIFVLWLRTRHSYASINCGNPSSLPKIGDCAPLSKLYQDNRGTLWLDNQNWFSTYLCSEKSNQGWYGVACNKDDSFVSSLTLRNNKLHCSIPSEVGLLTHLNGTFDLSYNNLTSQIPSQIGSLTGITRLDLSYNSLTGSIPIEVAELCANLNHNIPNSCILVGNTLHSPVPTNSPNPTTTASPTSGLSSFSSSVPTHDLTSAPSHSPSAGSKSGTTNNGLIAASVGIVLVGGTCIALCVLLAIRKTSLGGIPGMDPASVSLDGYAPFKDVVYDNHGDPRGAYIPPPDHGNGKHFNERDDMSSHEGSDSRESVILPGAFGHDLKAYLIQLKDLSLEKKPFAAGGSGQV